MVPLSHCRLSCTLVWLFLATHISAEGSDLTDAQIDVVSLRLTESSKLSWELGTRAQTILERNASSYSVLSRQRLPPQSNPDNATLSALRPIFDIANHVVISQSKNQTGPQPLMPDQSAADPASLGVCILIANWTKAAHGGSLDYAGVAKSQIDFLFSAVPRTSDGALSHRVSELQLWSDSVYMIPPFLAYYGVMSRNRSMVHEAYNQVRLYRNYLRDPQRSMWKHIVLGRTGTDPGFWSTGNGWVAAGMLRVHATIQNSEYMPSMKQELRDLARWVEEIHTGMYNNLDSTNIFLNYAGSPAGASTNNFYDAASTALLASTVYRAAQFLGQHGYLSHAEKSRHALSAHSPNSNSSSTSPFPSYEHFTPDGILVPVVDPYSVGSRANAVSPEGQAFVVQMHEAWNDWKKSKKNSDEGCAAVIGSQGSVLVVFVIWGLVCAFV